MGWKGTPKPGKQGKAPRRDSDTQYFILGKTRVDHVAGRAREAARSRRELSKLRNALRSLEAHAESLYPGTKARRDADSAVRTFKDENDL